MTPDTNQSSSPSARLFTLVTVALVIAALYFAKDILLPLALAVLLSFVLSSLVARLERLRLGRIPSVVIAVAFAFTLFGGAAWLATHQIVELGNQLPTYKDNLIAKIRSVRNSTGGKLDEAKEAIKDIGAELTEEEEPENTSDLRSVENRWLPWLSPQPEKARGKEKAVAVKVVELPPSPLSQVHTWLGPLVAPLSTAGIVIVLVIFMLVKREDLRNRIIQLVGTSSLYTTTEVIDDATSRLSGYLRMQLLINTIYGLVVAVGLAVLGVPNALLWGVLGLLLRFLPYVGPWIAAAMPIALSLAVSQGWSQPFWVFTLFLALELVVNNVLEPWLYGSSVGVSSLGVIVAAIFWTWLWGPIGLVLAMPLTVCLVVLGKHVPQLRFLPVLLGDCATLQSHEHLYQRLLSADDLEARKMAVNHVKNAGMLDFFDQVLIPALYLAERDRHAGFLSEQQESVVNETSRKLLQDLRQRHERETGSQEPANSAEKERSLRVLCISVRDQADETAMMMLNQVLSQAGHAVESVSHELLASEIIERIADHKCDAVVLSLLPPLGLRHGRYLCKRLRKRYVGLRIVVALFQGENRPKSKQCLLDSGADTVVTSLSHAVSAVRHFGKRRDASEVPEHRPVG